MKDSAPVRPLIVNRSALSPCARRSGVLMSGSAAVRAVMGDWYGLSPPVVEQSGLVGSPWSEATTVVTAVTPTSWVSEAEAPPPLEIVDGAALGSGSGS